MDIAAGVVGLVSFGLEVSRALYKFSEATSHADDEISALAHDIKLTSDVLGSISEVLDNDTISKLATDATKLAIQDCLERCRSIYADVKICIGKQTKTKDNGTLQVRTLAKLAFSFQSDKFEGSKRKLEYLMKLLTLLLSVLQVAACSQKATTSSSVERRIFDLQSRLDKLETESPTIAQDLELINVPKQKDIPPHTEVEHVKTMDNFSGTPSASPTRKDTESMNTKMPNNEHEARILVKKPIINSSSPAGQNSLGAKLPDSLGASDLDACADILKVMLNKVERCQAFQKTGNGSMEAIAAQIDFKTGVEKLMCRMQGLVDADLTSAISTKGITSQPSSLENTIRSGVREVDSASDIMFATRGGALQDNGSADCDTRGLHRAEKQPSRLNNMSRRSLAYSLSKEVDIAETGQRKVTLGLGKRARSTHDLSDQRSYKRRAGLSKPEETLQAGSEISATVSALVLEWTTLTEYGGAKQV